jgi:hypothetical protein
MNVFDKFTVQEVMSAISCVCSKNDFDLFDSSYVADNLASISKLLKRLDVDKYISIFKKRLNLELDASSIVYDTIAVHMDCTIDINIILKDNVKISKRDILKKLKDIYLDQFHVDYEYLSCVSLAVTLSEIVSNTLEINKENGELTYTIEKSHKYQDSILNNTNSHGNCTGSEPSATSINELSSDEVYEFIFNYYSIVKEECIDSVDEPDKCIRKRYVDNEYLIFDVANYITIENILFGYDNEDEAEANFNKYKSLMKNDEYVAMAKQIALDQGKESIKY